MKQQLSNQIKQSFNGIRKKHLKLIKTVNPDLLADHTSLALQQWAIKPKLMTSTAVGLGKAAMQNLDTKAEDEKTTRLRWFDVGYFLLTQAKNIGAIDISLERPTGDGGKLKIKKGKLFSKRSRRSYVISVDNDNIFDDLISSVNISETTNLIHTTPQLEKPLHWDNIYHPVAGDLIKNSNRAQRRWMSRRKNNRVVLNCINKHQDIAYKINTGVLDILESSLNDDIFTLNDKKDRMSEKQIESHRRLTATVLRIAKEIGEGDFWQYHYLDNRGRLYASTHYLNNGGSKLSKALFYSSEAKRLGTDGLFWLKYQAANTYGYDKATIDARVDFVDDHLDEWLAWNLYTDKEWQKADDAFGFLSAVLELQKAYKLEDPRDYISGLLVAFDASVSGLQILSAISKDEMAASLCNLDGSDTKGDYYLMIAEEWIKKCNYTSSDFIAYETHRDALRALNDSGKRSYLIKHFDALRALSHVFWSLHSELGRSLTKRSAMTYFYSCGPDTMGEHIMNDFGSDIDDLNEVFANWLGHKIHGSCKSIMVGPTKMMRLFIGFAKEMLKKDQQYSLLGHYNGFLMAQDYTEDRSVQVDVMLDGKKIQPRVIIQKGTSLDAIKITCATAPNVVHCLDSQIVYKLLNECHYNITCIHDSFSAIPADAGKLFEDTRSAFLDLFGFDPMKEIFDIDDFEYGEADVSKVLDDDFCFA